MPENVLNKYHHEKKPNFYRYKSINNPNGKNVIRSKAVLRSAFILSSAVSA